MSTSGTYGIIKDGHCYTTYQHSDMYTEGHPAELIAEAAEIAHDGNWDEIIDGWTHKAWVDHEDDALPYYERSHIQHPDGDVYQRNDWTYGMRPRMGHADMLSAGGWATDIADEVFAPDSGKHRGCPIVGAPSFRTGASMPIMMKAPVATEYRYGYTVLIDADNRELVGATISDANDFVPFVAVSLDDAEALQEAADWAGASVQQKAENLNPRPRDDAEIVAENSGWVHRPDDDRSFYHASAGGPQIEPFDPYDTYADRFSAAMEEAGSVSSVKAAACKAGKRDWGKANKHLKDGQWLRPEGFPPLLGTPKTFPAQQCRAGDYSFAATTEINAAQQSWDDFADAGPTAPAKEERRGRPSRFTAEQQRHYGHQSRIRGAAVIAKELGVKPSMIYSWRHRHRV